MAIVKSKKIMFNRIKRRSALITFFLIQFILFSTYIFKHYQYNDSDDVKNKSDQSTLSPKPDHLPAGLIEKSDRLLVNNNYKKTANQKNHLQSTENIESLNVSLVKDVDQQQAIIQCSTLPTDLGNFTNDE